MLDNLAIMPLLWDSDEQPPADLKSTLEWLEVVDSLGVTEQACVVPGQPSADPEWTQASSQEVLWAVARLPVRKALYRLINLIKQHPEQTYSALEDLARSDPKAARWLAFYWLQLCRWSNVQRLFAPARLTLLAEILQQSRHALCRGSLEEEYRE